MLLKHSNGNMISKEISLRLTNGPAPEFPSSRLGYMELGIKN